MTFDGSPESFARAPVNYEKLTEVYNSLDDQGMNDDYRDVLKQLIHDKQQEIARGVIMTIRKRKNIRRHDQYDEATAPAMARLSEVRDKREKTKKSTHNAAQDGTDLRFRDNTDDVNFLAALHKRLDETGSLEKGLQNSNQEGDAREANYIATSTGP